LIEKLKLGMKRVGHWLALPFIYLWKGIKWIPKGIWWCLKWLWYNIFPRYTLHVSYNQVWGDADDQTFEVKKFFKKQEKFLKFKTVQGDIVEIRGSEGLNYRIEEV
tara:strand:- start:4072 stop:4389 length:318 start_codon:yes stop_codon:yes gene_type:complete